MIRLDTILYDKIRFDWKKTTKKDVNVVKNLKSYFYEENKKVVLHPKINMNKEYLQMSYTEHNYMYYSYAVK